MSETKAIPGVPEKHRNPCVRVSAFSQKPHLLDRPMQDHIIARTKHAK
ncbi:MAG: hypothetical protein JXQ73_03540 [Phycisphaerae bacterium]|nr:hypothetical protein [Phycisphaerae bacterium]